MYRTDRASQNLGLEILDVAPGSVRVSMTVRPEMVNGHGLCHGGVIFTLADSAFAFACNSEGKITVALDVSISFPKAVKESDMLIAEAKQVNDTRKTGLYLIEVKNQYGELVALFKGTCYKTEKNIEGLSGLPLD